MGAMPRGGLELGALDMALGGKNRGPWGFSIMLLDGRRLICEESKTASYMGLR